MPRIKVLNIIGCGRSGSTILGNVLGQLPGWVHVGELCYVWNRGLMRRTACGCGELFDRCEFWQRVLDRSGLSTTEADAARLADYPRRANRRMALTVLRGRGPLELAEGIDEYLDALIALYEAIHEETGSRVIIDSTKAPSHSYLLGAADRVDLRVLHLVRDARGVAHSWDRKVVRRDGNPDDPVSMKRFSATRSAVKWAYANLSVEMLRTLVGRDVSTLLYEDFVADPRGTVARIERLAGEEETEHTPFVSDRVVRLDTTHTVWGNPSRLASGEVELRRDGEWRSKMSAGKRGWVHAMTWPLQRRYRQGGKFSPPPVSTVPRPALSAEPSTATW